MKTILIAGLFALTSVAFLPAPASAQKAKAKKEFDKGVAAMESHDYKEALNHFETAYKAAPHWMVLAHVGSCHAKLNNPVAAVEAYERFLRDGGDDINPEQRATAREAIDEQRKKIGTLQLLVKPKESEVRIDGESIGNPPFEPIQLRAGPHHVIVVRGEEEVEQDFTIEAGKEKVLKLYPNEEAVVAVPAPVAPAPDSQPVDVPERAGDWGPSEDTERPIVAKSPDRGPANTGVVRINSNVPGSLVVIDDVAAGVAPLETVVSTGEHSISVGASGYATYEVSVTVQEGMASSLDVSLVSESEAPKRVSPPFVATASVAGVGLATGVVGWVLFVYNRNSEENYFDELYAFSKANSGTWDYDAMCGQSYESGTKEDYFCTTESQRQTYARNERIGLALGIAGTSLFAVTGTIAAILYAKPELFFRNKSGAEVMVVPIADQRHFGLVLSASF